MYEGSRSAVERLREDGDLVLSRSMADGGLSPILEVTTAVEQPVPGSLLRSRAKGRTERLEPSMNAQNRQILRERSPMSFGVIVALSLAGAAQHRHDHGAGSDGFQAMISGSVARMHADMDVPFTGNADNDFARMMIPHHQGAIDMAMAELRYGKDKRLQRLAQEIIVEQQQEIAVMHLALGDPLPPGSPAPTQINSEAPEEK